MATAAVCRGSPAAPSPQATSATASPTRREVLRAMRCMVIHSGLLVILPSDLPDLSAYGPFTHITLPSIFTPSFVSPRNVAVVPLAAC